MMRSGVFNIINDNLRILMLNRVIGGDYVKKWCELPYQANSLGCPQVNRCKPVPMWNKISDSPFHFIIRTFNLDAHAKAMKVKFPAWSDKQCRNSRLWQSHQDRLLRDDADKFAMSLPYSSTVMARPEMNGVNVYSTCRIHGLIIHKNPIDIIYRIAMVGRAKIDSLQEWFK
jgi:hypothetical protein